MQYVSGPLTNAGRLPVCLLYRLSTRWVGLTWPSCNVQVNLPSMYAEMALHMDSCVAPRDQEFSQSALWVAVWVDFNQDGNFTQDELQWSTTKPVGVPGPYIIYLGQNVAVPATGSLAIICELYVSEAARMSPNRQPNLTNSLMFPAPSS